MKLRGGAAYVGAAALAGGIAMAGRTFNSRCMCELEFCHHIRGYSGGGRLNCGARWPGYGWFKDRAGKDLCGFCHNEYKEEELARIARGARDAEWAEDRVAQGRYMAAVAAGDQAAAASRAAGAWVRPPLISLPDTLRDDDPDIDLGT